MKKSSKLLSLILAASMVTSLGLAGCAGGDPAPASSKTTESKTSSEIPADPALDTSKEVNLVMYLLGDPPADNAKVFEQINAKMKEKINATLEPKYFSWSDYEQKYPLVFASGEDFDIIYSADWAGYIGQATKQGYYEITKEALEKYAPMTAASQHPDAWDQSLVNGKSYMLPMNYKELSANTYLVRGDLMAKYNITDVNGLDNIIKYLDVIAQNEKQMIPLDIGSDYDASVMFDRVFGAMHNGKYGGVGPWQAMAVVELNDPDLKVMSTIDTPEYLETVKKMKEWKDKGYWSKSAVVNTTDNRDSFKSGKSALATMNINTAKSMYTEISQAHPEWDVRVVDAQNGTSATLTAFWGNGMSIFAKSKNPERALMALDLLRNNEELHDLFSFGIEGVHYEKAGDNRIKLLETNANYPYDGNCNWGIRNDEYWKLVEGGIPNYDELYDNWVKTAEVYKYAFFTFDDSGVKNEIAAINDVFSSNYKLLNLGFVDDPATDIKKMSDKMKAAGVEKVYTALHDQLVAYEASRAK